MLKKQGVPEAKLRYFPNGTDPMVQVAKGRFRAVTGTNGKSRQRARESFPMERYSEKVRPGSGDPGAMMAVGRGSARCRGDRDARPIPLPFPDSSTGQCPCQGSEARGRLPPRSALSLNAEFERRTANRERRTVRPRTNSKIYQLYGSISQSIFQCRQKPSFAKPAKFFL